MKISKLYSNKEDVFGPIVFNEGFNVIFAKVEKPKDNAKDSHNLGKTLLIELIEFMMLKTFEPTLFLKKHYELFQNFEFYLEIKLNSGKYLTIKRTVKENTKISFKLHDERNQNFTTLNDSDWTNYKVSSFDKSIEILNKYLDLTSISPWFYRKGISYFLRNQKDYLDVFQINKYSLSEHAEWKPYVAKILGFSDELIKEKYYIDSTITSREEYKKEYEQRTATKAEEYDKLKGALEIKRAEVDEVSKEFDKFNFYEEELKMNRQLVEEIESKVSELNNGLYNIQYEISKIENSISQKVKFDLNEIKTVYEEAKIYFNTELLRDYDALLKFNKSLYEERSKYLKERLEKLNKEREEIKSQLLKLNQKRADMLKILRGENTFTKFKALQKVLVENKTEIVRLESQLNNLNVVAVIQREIEELNTSSQKIVNSIKQSVAEGNQTYSEIRTSFNKIIKEILNVFASLYIVVNKEGNLEFKADIAKDEKSTDMTSEGEGTTYRKVLCAAFDLAVLQSYSTKQFFRFVYHDGILEGLDNRKKQNLLNLVKRYCNEFGIQYIMTVIDADLPRDAEDNKIYFDDCDIVKRLDDSGDSGRLFKMHKF